MAEALHSWQGNPMPKGVESVASADGMTRDRCVLSKEMFTSLACRGDFRYHKTPCRESKAGKSSETHQLSRE